jgi:hypothetical protein
MIKIPSREDVERLKRDWYDDPIWDIYNTEGFEAYTEELRIYQKECEEIWEEKSRERMAKTDAEADKLGVRGLYRLILEHKELLERHERAIEYLGDGHSHQAYRALKGWDE